MPAFCASLSSQEMERTRDVSPKSIAGSDVSSLPSTLASLQASKKKSAKSLVEGHSTLLPLLLEAINEATAEEKARSKEISELLSILELDPKSMPKDIQDAWARATAILRIEGLSSLDEVTLTLYMRHKKRQTMRQAREDRKLKTRFNSVQRRQTEVLEKNRLAQKSVESLQEVVNDEASNNEQHVNGMVNAVKLNDYREFMERTEESLEDLDVHDYFPGNILEKYKTYLELQEELTRVNDSLIKYSDLPPNLSEARVMLAEKEKYLKDLEHEIFEKMK